MMSKTSLFYLFEVIFGILFCWYYFRKATFH